MRIGENKRKQTRSPLINSGQSPTITIVKRKHKPQRLLPFVYTPFLEFPILQPRKRKYRVYHYFTKSILKRENYQHVIES